MVYFAGSLSGATLEILVHTDDYGTIDGNFSYIPVGIPETCVDSLDKSLLPPAWNSPVIIAATQTLGDEWISSSSSAILRVPSAITQGEYNFLGNPAHPDFSKLKIGPACEFKLDARL